MLSKGPAAYPRYAYRNASGDLLERARQLEVICARYDIPLAAAALQFSLRDPRIVSTIVGISRPERLDQESEAPSFLMPPRVRKPISTV